jgi:hypothetical protein
MDRPSVEKPEILELIVSPGMAGVRAAKSVNLE